jgi:hypothetical protein
MAFRFKALSSVIVVSILAVYFLPVLMHHDVYSNDAAQHISWMYRYSNPRLFANCEMRDYFSDAFAPFGFRLLYNGLARITDVKVASELLCFPLAVLTLVGAYSLGCLVTDGNVIGGIANAAIILLGGLAGIEFNYMGPIAGGLQRSFALPILVWGVVSTAQRRPLLTAAMLLASALFYPPALLVLGLFQVMVSALDIVHRQSPSKETLWLVLSGVVSMGVLWRLQEQSAPYGPILTLAEMRRMPDFYPGGVFYTPILFTTKVSYVTNAFPMRVPEILGWTVGVVACAWFLRRAIRVEVWFTLLSGFLLYGLAYALLFRLYDPERYPLYGLLLFHLMIIPPACVAIWAKIRGRFVTSRQSLWFSKMSRRWTVLTAIGAVVVVAAICLVAHRYDVKGGGVRDDIPDSVYQYLSTLPVDTCIAGHPTDVDFVPLRSHRCVPLVLDALNVRQRDFRLQVFDQLGDILRLMYAGDISEIRAARGRLNCRIFLVNADRYTTDYLAIVRPTDATIAKLRQKALTTPPLLLHPPGTAVLFRDGPISVVDLDRLEDDPRRDNSPRTPLNPKAEYQELHCRHQHGAYRRAKDAAGPPLG